MTKKTSKENKKVAKPTVKPAGKKVSTEKATIRKKTTDKKVIKALSGKSLIEKESKEQVQKKKEKTNKLSEKEKISAVSKAKKQGTEMKASGLLNKPSSQGSILAVKKNDKTKQEVKSSLLTKSEGSRKEIIKKSSVVEIPLDVPDTEDGKKWAELRKKFGNDPAAVYSISGVFEANSPLEHKVLGWGYIIGVLNDRLEVVFKDGIKHLISNYKSQ